MPKLSSRAKMCINNAKQVWGNGWYKLTPEMREAFVCRELVYMVLAQDNGNIEANGKGVLLALMEDMRQALNTEEEK